MAWHLTQYSYIFLFPRSVNPLVSLSFYLMKFLQYGLFPMNFGENKHKAVQRVFIQFFVSTIPDCFLKPNPAYFYAIRTSEWTMICRVPLRTETCSN
jgi:hypothetical protein